MHFRTPGSMHFARVTRSGRTRSCRSLSPAAAESPVLCQASCASLMARRRVDIKGTHMMLENGVVAQVWFVDCVHDP